MAGGGTVPPVLAKRHETLYAGEVVGWRKKTKALKVGKEAAVIFSVLMSKTGFSDVR